MSFKTFQSTHSRGVRRYLTPNIKKRSYISIHALARSATIPILESESSHLIFQSTHSRGVRPVLVIVIVAVVFISIHALARSATFDKNCRDYSSYISIHALARSATKALKSVLSDFLFQSTHSRGVRRSIRLL